MARADHRPWPSTVATTADKGMASYSGGRCKGCGVAGEKVVRVGSRVARTTTARIDTRQPRPCLTKAQDMSAKEYQSAESRAFEIVCTHCTPALPNANPVIVTDSSPLATESRTA
eukprot:2201219-Rhodomonas_salina.1